jgi:spermidine synthase
LKTHIPPFLLGFLALSFQIFLLREFLVHFYGNEITFGFILASWLLWGGMGSIFASKIRWKTSWLPYAYYAVILILPFCLAILRLSRFVTRTLPGEITGITPMLMFSLVLSFFLSLPLGSIFVFNALFLKGNVSRVYLMESLGSACAGLLVYFFFIPYFSNWKAAAFLGGLGALIIFLSIGSKRQIYTLAVLFLCLTIFCVLDLPSQKIYWKPFRLTESKDTPFGKLQMIQTEEQLSLYNNSLLAYSYPDLASSEESVHFALLQNPNAEAVLLIGGGAGGSLRQALKYPRTKVDYVEIDPEIIRLSLRYLPEREKAAFKNKRVHIFYQDGRAYLKQTPKKYDVIILNLPDPATAQLNRFYTKEFFEETFKKLTSGGIFSFRVSSAENYISPDLQNYLASLYFSLKQVFPLVEIVPGDSNIFLAGTNPISLAPQELIKKIEQLELKNTYVGSNYLYSRLSPFRQEFLREKILSGRKTINRDLVPISYLYNSILWSTQFQNLETFVFHFLSKLSRFWLLDLPLIGFVLFTLILAWKQKKTSFYLLPLAVMGLTTIIVEIIVLIAFQTFYGYLYQKVALLFSSFMIGLFVGALRGKARKNPAYPHILPIQFGFIFLLFLMILGFSTRPPEPLFFLLLFSFGFLGGDLFIVSNYLFMKHKKNYGVGYGLDLLGSFFGALVVSSLLIPLFGLPLLVKYIFLLNSICLLFLVWGLKTKEI